MRARSGATVAVWGTPGIWTKSSPRFKGNAVISGEPSTRTATLLDILVQSRRNRRAAIRFFRKVLKGQGRLPSRLITDKLRNYSAAHRIVMPSVPHSTRQYENNRAEASHQPTRQRERQMRRFKSVGHAQHFLSVHGLVQNLFRTGRATCFEPSTIASCAHVPSGCGVR